MRRRFETPAQCWFAALVVLLGVLLGGPRPAAATNPPGALTYRPPVVAPVSDPYRPPPKPWMAGNRGIEYATVPGSVVRSIGPGVVAFAGPVAGSLHVTILHPDGLRSSYSYLAAVRVRVGARLAAGVAVGVAGNRLHLGIRRDKAYVDPASLWGQRISGGRVVLVPLDGGGTALGVQGQASLHFQTGPPPGRSRSHFRPSPPTVAIAAVLRWRNGFGFR